jgi:hypothetical protein
MEVDWQTMETAPDSGEEFMVSWLGDWHPRCKIMNGALYEYGLDDRSYENYMTWVWMTDIEGEAHLFWAPQPKPKAIRS